MHHQLRAFTPDDEKALRATARTFPKSAYDLEEVLTMLGIGEAVVTVQSEKGTPTPVAATMIRAPLSLMAPTPADQLEQILRSSPFHAKYATAVDRSSAREMLAAKLGGPAVPGVATSGTAAPAPAPPPLPPPLPEPSGSRRGRRTPTRAPEPSVLDQIVRSDAVEGFLRSFGSSMGREITRGIFGTGRRRRR